MIKGPPTVVDIGAILNPKPSLARQALEYTVAKLGPEATETIITERLATCRTCDRREEHHDKEYCNACRCPRWRDAELQHKTKMMRARCPLGKWKE